ncbi:hypothetical protein HaLaN_29865, partial [Haematococcus lacustris]
MAVDEASLAKLRHSG